MELEKICRTCLGFAGPLLSIYDGGTSDGHANCIADMLSDVTKMKPRNGDNLPEKVCITCISEINRCYSFKMKCENSNRTLRQLIPDALPEEDFVPKSKVTTVNRAVQTLVEKKKQYKSVLVQTVHHEISVQKPTVTKQKSTRQTTPAKKIKLESVGEEKKHIKEEANVKAVVPTKKEIVVVANSNTEDSTNSQETTIEQTNFAIFEEYVYDDDNDGFSNPKEPEHFTQKSYDENVRHEFERLYFTTKQTEGIELTVMNANDQRLELEDEDEEEEQEESKEHVEYHISICNETDEVKASKEEASYKRADYQCPHCVMCFVSVKNLKKHVMKRHSMSIVETITEGQNGKIEELIEIDMDTQSSNAASTDNGYETKKQRKCAPRVKLPDEPKPAIIKTQPVTMDYTCNICKGSFAQRKSLLFHARLNACNLKSYSCSECGRVFITEENLIKHKSTHVLSNPCDECHKVFPSKEELSQHMIDEHNRKVRNQCTICLKVFTMLSTLRDHMRTHTGEKPFLCTICGRGFSQNTNLKQHMLRHSDNKPFKCDECPNSYCTKAEYYSHKRTHTGDQPFKCDFCDARFTSNSSMNKHRRKHTGERPYACDLCPMRFACLNVMKNHRRTHTGEKPFKCSFCTKVFAQKGDCLSHQRTHLRVASGSETNDLDESKNRCYSPGNEIVTPNKKEEVDDEEHNLLIDESNSANEGEIMEFAFE